MVKEPAGPTALGTRWHERVRIAPGFWLHIESVVTQIAGPSRLGMDFHSRWFAGHLTYEIQADPGGSVLRQEETLQPRGPVRWLERSSSPTCGGSSFAASKTSGSFSNARRRPGRVRPRPRPAISIDQ
jgi:hypothetical protein